MWDGVEWREMCRSKLADSEALPTSFITALLGLYVPGRRGCLSPTPIKIVNLSAPVHQFGSTGLQICVAELTEGFNFLGGGGGEVLPFNPWKSQIQFWSFNFTCSSGNTGLY